MRRPAFDLGIPRTGSRALVLVGLFLVAAIAVAALSRTDDAPRLDPSPAPSDVRLDQPSSGRILRESEVRDQLGPEWADARYRLERWADIRLPSAPATTIDADRLVWTCVRSSAGAWELRVYDAASGLRLATLGGTGAPPP